MTGNSRGGSCHSCQECKAGLFGIFPLFGDSWSGQGLEIQERDSLDCAGAESSNGTITNIRHATWDMITDPEDVKSILKVLKILCSPSL